MNYLNQQLLIDLDINNISSTIDKTITTYGKIKFKELFTILHYNENKLIRRQNLLSSIIYNPLHTHNIINKLYKIKKLENVIENAFIEKTKTKSNTNELISSNNFMKIYAPIIVLILYILFFIIINIKGEGLNLVDYTVNIYNNCKNQMQNVIDLVITNNKLSSFMVNILAKLYIFYQLYTLYNIYNTSISSYRKYNKFMNTTIQLRKLIDYVIYIHKNDIFLEHEKMLILPTINELDNIFASDKLNNKYSMFLMKNIHKYETKFNTILQYIGILDSFISVAKLNIEEEYSFPILNFNKSKKYFINIKNFKNPCQDYTNDYFINKSIITLPNNNNNILCSKDILLATLLSQTIGLCPCSYIELTPFQQLITNFNITKNDEIYDALTKTKIKYFAIINKPDTNIDKNKVDNGVMILLD